MTFGERSLLEAFNAAFNAHDVPGMMALTTPDCVFENTFPAPDGTRYEGQDEVRGFWVSFFAASPQAHIEVEEMFGGEGRAVQRWVYRWVDRGGVGGHVRGVDVFRFEQGLIAEKLSYVKG